MMYIVTEDLPLGDLENKDPAYIVLTHGRALIAARTLARANPGVTYVIRSVRPHSYHKYELQEKELKPL